jgi:SAM-dependent methyltransferase
MEKVDLEKAARCGEPSYVWREGQDRRLKMIREAAGHRLSGFILENGCGVGMYLAHLREKNNYVFGLDFDLSRTREAYKTEKRVINAAGEFLPYPPCTFDLILSNEVIEHVADDRKTVAEMVRCLKPGGRLVLFCPNRGYPFETHGFYWKGRYHFGNIPFINWLPGRIRNKLAPHVRAYSRCEVQNLFSDLNIRTIRSAIIFGGYDNLISRWGFPGRAIRWIIQNLEHTPFQLMGLSHFWVVEKSA